MEFPGPASWAEESWAYQRVVIYNVPSGQGEPAPLWLTHHTSVFVRLLVPDGGELKAGRWEWGRADRKSVV